ncbi:MAG: type II toxin-antitoxin system VapC family toxin, partial [Candidatus Desantisbacteria bacterium]
LREVQPLRIMEIALEHGLTAYDAVYLALAEDEQCDLWTGDGAFYKAVKDSSPRVKWIGDYTREMDQHIK